MNLVLTPDSISLAALIFTLRVINSAIGTVRLVTLARGQRTITVILAFFEAIAFAVTISGVVTDFSNVLILFTYCSGFAVGAWLGMVLEAKLVTAFMIINIFANQKGHEIALALRNAGFGVTEMMAAGHTGDVTMLRSVVDSRQASQLMSIVKQTNPDAFVAVEQARTVQGGWLRPQRNQPM